MKHATARVLSLAAMLAGLGSGMAQAETLHIWARENDDSIKALEQMAAAFTAKTGIDVEFFHALNDFEQRLARAAAGRQLPDMVLTDAASLGQMLDMGIIDPVDPAKIAGSGDIVPTAWKSAEAYDGKYYGVPVSAQAFALFIRKDWREKLGLPVPKTWDDMMKMAEAFTHDDPDGNGKADTFGFTLPASTTRGYANWFLSNFIWQAGGDFVKTSDKGFTPDLATPQAAEALKYIRTMVCEGLTQPGAINATTSDSVPAFRSGQTGMYLSGPYHIALFDREPGKDKIEVVPPPAGPGGVSSLAEGESLYFMKGSQHVDAARKFAEFFISPEGQKMGMEPGDDNIPVVRLPVIKSISVEDVRHDPRWQVFKDVYDANSHYVPGVPNWTPIRMETAEGFNRILAHCDSDIPAELAQIDTGMAKELKAQKVLAPSVN